MPVLRSSPRGPWQAGVSLLSLLAVLAGSVLASTATLAQTTSTTTVQRQASVASGTSTTTTRPTPAQVFANPVYQRGLALWRDDNPQKFPKGSCSSCHGADFFDLARGGFDDATIRRRAILDGATQEEATALIAAVRYLRTTYALPATDARNFRPFQPGGAVLEPDLDRDPSINEPTRFIRRDIAFGRQLTKLTPALFGAPIETLAQAHQIRDQVLAVQPRTLKTGVLYPLWSADRHFGEQFGTLNDWVADIGQAPRPDKAAAWRSLQDAYLRQPSNETFWRMYDAVGVLTAPRFTTAGNRVDEAKFRSALIGQHLMRSEALKLTDFVKPTGLAFSRLQGSPFFAQKPDILLPNPMWDFAERARVILDGDARRLAGGEVNTEAARAREALDLLGNPDFVLESVSPDQSWKDQADDIRLDWFWIGFVFDPSFARIDKSNSTIAGEYFLASLRHKRLYMHHQFVNLMSLLYRGFVPEAMKDVQDNQSANLFLPRWQIRAGEHLRDNWGENSRLQFPAALKAEHRELWIKLTGNAYRASLLIYEDEINRNRVPFRRDYTSVFDNMREHFQRYHPATAARDIALVERVRLKSNLVPQKN